MPVKDKERKEPSAVNAPLLPKRKLLRPDDVDILLTEEQKAALAIAYSAYLSKHPVPIYGKPSCA